MSAIISQTIKLIQYFHKQKDYKKMYRTNQTQKKN